MNDKPIKVESLHLLPEDDEEALLWRSNDIYAFLINHYTQTVPRCTRALHKWVDSSVESQNGYACQHCGFFASMSLCK